jgi:hypothetical protein
MKNQYFGDVRDLFKYDLIQEIMQKSPGIKQFSFIPMLTENDTGSDGNKRITHVKKLRKRPGSQNSDLIEYLRKYDTIAPDDKNFREIGDFFEEKGIRTAIYHPADHLPEDYFTHGGRDVYFSGIPNDYLTSALVFVDPDNGLEVKKPSEKHIRYPEVRSLFERMSDDSLLMIYQHFPRKEHGDYTKLRLQELRDETKADPLWISDKEIIFFFLAKNGETHPDLKGVLFEYASRYGKKCQVINGNSPSWPE